MAMKIQPPDFRKKSYDRYKQELSAWKEVTEMDKKKQGIAVALTLPDDETGIREKIFEEMDLEELKTDDGLNKLLIFMDKHLGKDELTDGFEKFEDFENFQRSPDQNINEYIAKFDQKYKRLEKLDMKLPCAILAFKLLRKANITSNERLLVLTGMNYTEKNQLYEQAKRSLTKFKGQQGGSDRASAPVVKLEPAYITVSDHEEALVAAGYSVRPPPRYNNSYRGYHDNSYRGYHDGRNWGRGGGSSYRGRGGGTQTHGGRNVNPPGPDGKPIRCRACGSYRHVVAKCPDSWENLKSVNIVNSDTEKAGEQVTLYTGNHDNLHELTRDARGCVVLDSACSSTVCGEEWMNQYIDQLDDVQYSKVIKSPGTKLFKFGGGERLHSQASVIIPGTLAGKSILINTDVVKSDIPLLLSKNAMKKAKVKLDLENDTAEVMGTSVSLNITSSGHYCLPLCKDEIPVESVCVVNLDAMDCKGKREVLSKLHRQFAHPTTDKLKALMKDAGAWNDGLYNLLLEVYEMCKVCKIHKKTPSRPIVSLPLAKKFNDKVAIDLKKWGNGWILHMVDVWSRFTISVVISSKKPRDVIDGIMQKWIGVWGVMNSILSDNGGEFNADEIREVCSFLNVEVCTTAAYSPFQNGVCERNHAVVDSILTKLRSEYPSYDLQTLLCWANMAKNSMQMWNGFSSYQLAVGSNPNLPNILTASPPALEGLTTSEIFAKHLNTLHSARKAFVESDADERIRRALRNKVRAAEQVYSPGDRVFYKRDGQERWIGPGKVIFQDGKVVFVRHGGTFVRVSPNRLIPAGSHSYDETPAQNETTSTSETLQDNDTDSQYEIIGLHSENHEVDVDIPTVQNQPVRVLSSEKLMPQKNDRIQYRVKENWVNATVLNRAGKACGKNKHWFNVHNDTGEDLSVDLGKLQWQKCQETVNVVIIPKRHQNNKS